ncbi:hypothetical protein N7492_010557 [Penicillium capsulatum]|uniref:Uncharacterized protein n=1 Tax=Penicillium capsulatum TaxID=69766 RepID=A0A9W9HP98_9EURO|nr:hypothetical protein N7492_010557 [Penicillium capsulatum]KAJ6113058.1 hypothetical protein N7512_008382 [Penicillium capsulatum]
MADYCWQTPASSTGSQWNPDYASFNQSANMQDWVRAFPRPRPSRVVKPRSAGNSPSAATRRRTTVGQNMYGPSNQYQSSLEAALLASASRNSRPISWHPSSMRTRGLSNPQVPDFTPENYAAMGTMPDQCFPPLPVYGSDNMLSYSLSADPNFTQHGYFPMYSDMPISQPTPSLSIPSSQVDPMAWDVSAADLSAMTQTTSDGWSLDMLSMANIPPAETTCPSYASVPSPGEFSGPSTPEFLPIQQFEDDSAPSAPKSSKPEEELVGMGLYSQPDRSLSQAPQETLGKGLKLEETFSPSAEDKDEGPQDAGNEANESEAIHQTGPAEPAPMMQPNVMVPKQPSKQALNLLHKSFFFDHDNVDQQAMTAAQPFASLNQPCMSYGYGWI